MPNGSAAIVQKVRNHRNILGMDALKIPTVTTSFQIVGKGEAHRSELRAARELR